MLARRSLPNLSLCISLYSSSVGADVLFLFCLALKTAKGRQTSQRFNVRRVSWGSKRIEMGETVTLGPAVNPHRTPAGKPLEVVRISFVLFDLVCISRFYQPDLLDRFEGGVVRVEPTRLQVADSEVADTGYDGELALSPACDAADEENAFTPGTNTFLFLIQPRRLRTLGVGPVVGPGHRQGFVRRQVVCRRTVVGPAPVRSHELLPDLVRRLRWWVRW